MQFDSGEQSRLLALLIAQPAQTVPSSADLFSTGRYNPHLTQGSYRISSFMLPICSEEEKIVDVLQ